ncbi:DUF4139 domain-containing protein [Cytobacillus oceanisediminis]|uniref:DUF4139 domain-containing protein n=1 Tax=Cytobacillus oceanisediminis TaxID=665099 RepID=UPI003735FEE4
MDVAEKIETDSIIISGVNILETNYEYDLVSKEKLMEKYIGSNVYLYDKQKNTREEYRLLSSMNGIVLEHAETKEIMINPEGEIILPKLPGGLLVRPALVWKVKPGPVKDMTVSYLTKGISWGANYVMELTDEGFQLAGWVKIDNHSGATYQDAQIKVIAGEVNRIEDNWRIEEDDMILYTNTEKASPEFTEKSFADYHLYKLERLATLKNNQTKQINFLQVEKANLKRYYECTKWSEDVKILIEFENSQENRLGLPLPKGKVKVYQKDSEDSSLEFIGEDSISHTSKNEKVKLQLGTAFDIKCTHIEKNSYRKGRYEYKEHKYIIRNHKEEALIRISHYIHEPIGRLLRAAINIQRQAARRLSSGFMLNLTALKK